MEKTCTDLFGGRGTPRHTAAVVKALRRKSRCCTEACLGRSRVYSRTQLRVKFRYDRHDDAYEIQIKMLLPSYSCDPQDGTTHPQHKADTMQLTHSTVFSGHRVSTAAPRCAVVRRSGIPQRQHSVQPIKLAAPVALTAASAWLLSGASALAAAEPAVAIAAASGDAGEVVIALGGTAAILGLGTLLIATDPQKR